MKFIYISVVFVAITAMAVTFLSSLIKYNIHVMNVRQVIQISNAVSLGYLPRPTLSVLGNF